MPARTDSDIRAETAAAWREHPTVEFSVEVPCRSSTGKEKVVTVQAVDRVVTVDTHGSAAVFDRDAFFTLAKAVDRAAQVVA